MATDPTGLRDYAYWRARGLSKTEAYLKVSPDVDRSSACTIAGRWESLDSFKALVTELRAEYMSQLAAQEDEEKKAILDELKLLAFSSVDGIIDVVTGGDVSLAAIPPEVKKTVSSISISITENEKGKSTRVSLGMHNKNQALKLMMERSGMIDSLSTHIAGLREYGLIIARDDAGNWTIQQDEFSGSLVP